MNQATSAPLSARELRIAAAQQLAARATQALAEASAEAEKLPPREFPWIMARYAEATALSAMARYELDLAALAAPPEEPRRPRGRPTKAAAKAAEESA